jgi:hypothetical protein
MGPHWTNTELVHEFHVTRPRHQGVVSIAASILSMSPDALARRFYRMRANGIVIDFFDDTKTLRIKK